MTDRRSGHDRRVSHGTRSGYQAGCRRTCCRRANAEYQQQLYALKAKGTTPAGILIPAGPTWRLIRSFLREGFSKAEIARRLGLPRPVLDVHTQFVRAATHARVARLADALNAEGE